MASIAGDRVDFVKFDIVNHARAVEIMEQYVLTLTNMPIKFDIVTWAER